MARYAVWRRRPDDPTTATGWLLRWNVPNLSVDRQAFARLWPKLGAGVAAVLAWIFLLHERIDLIVLGGLALTALSRTIRTRRPDADAHTALPTFADGPNAMPVTLTIFDNKRRITARETGWVAFADGWLVYEGLRTSFSLAQTSTVHSSYLPYGVSLGLSDGRRIDLAVLTDAEKTYLPASRGEIPRLSKKVRAWLEEDNAQGEPILPAREEHPETTAGRLTFPAIGALFTLPFGLGTALGGEFQLAAIFLSIGLACLGWLEIGLRRFQRELPTRME